MLVTFDPETDTIYLKISDEYLESVVELDAERTIEYGEDGRAIGVEILGVSTGIVLEGLPEDVREVLEELAAISIKKGPTHG